MPNYLNPFESRGPQTGGAIPGNANSRLALDNLIRRELKVGDPSDPMQIAGALLERYKSDPRARAISQEAQGMPFLQTTQAAPPLMAAPTSAEAEMQQAKDDVERDLAELTTNALLKDVTPEIRGWSQAIRSSLAEGIGAARFALDPTQRDKAFGIRRQLADYARLARLVGALTPAVNQNYRKLAQSLDEAASVILVMMGEALANVGFAGGRYLLQAPWSELQVRRDAVLYALRNLIGSTQQTYGPNEWPRGIDAYRNLFRALDAQGQGDLRALLQEQELTRIMDELIQRAAHGTVEGLRALGATAQLDLGRFRRLVGISQHLVSPESPPLLSFLEALQLFVEAFDPSGGFRLLRVCRPPVLFYGLYGIGRPLPADDRLMTLIIQRGRLASELDCFMACACDDNRIFCQVALDKLLYDIDRSIDLYALGQEDFGLPERRAAAYSFLIDALIEGILAPGTTDQKLSPCGGMAQNLGIGEALEVVRNNLRPLLRTSDASVRNAASALSTFGNSVLDALTHYGVAGTDLSTSLKDPGPSVANVNFASMANIYRFAHKGLIDLERKPGVPEDDIPEDDPFVEEYFSVLRQELCLQQESDRRFRNLVETMSPGCASLPEVFSMLEDLSQRAIDAVSFGQCERFDPRIPPHYETSLDSLADDIDRRGIGRP